MYQETVRVFSQKFFPKNYLTFIEEVFDRYGPVAMAASANLLVLNFKMMEGVTCNDDDNLGF